MLKSKDWFPLEKQKSFPFTAQVGLQRKPVDLRKSFSITGESAAWKRWPRQQKNEAQILLSKSLLF